MNPVAYPRLIATAVPDARVTPEALALLSQAMQETHTPVAQIGDAIERMMHALHGQVPEAQLREVFARDLALCVHGLQFHDRLAQQLSCVRDLITPSGTLPGATLPAAARFPQGDPAGDSIELF